MCLLEARIKTLIIGVLLIFVLLPCPVYAVTQQEAETLPLAITDVSATNITQTSATISWNTTINATSQVFYDIEFHEDIADYAYYTPKDTTPVTEHSVHLTGLSPFTTYHYRAKSVAVVNSTEFTAISEDYTFTTLAMPLTPMSRFEIDHAKIEFKKKPNDDRARVKGELELDLVNGNGVDVSELVTVTVGPLSETITMVEKGKKGEKWQYRRPKGYEGIIKHMTINWKKGEFDIHMDNADFSGVTNPVTISIQIGDDLGKETILMKVKKHHWDYKTKKHHSDDD